MGKILLCGNGINIEFEKKFQLTEFIALLLNEKELRLFFNSIRHFFTPRLTTIEPFNVFSNFNAYHKRRDNFCWIVKKCRKEIIASKNNFAKNGVESVFKQLFEKVEEYLAFDEDANLSYEEFENTFREIFFSYIWKLQNESFKDIVEQLTSFYPNFKNKLEDYMKIITLNYDLLLERIIPKNLRDIIHWHGAIKEKRDGSLDFSKCVLGTLTKPKSSEFFRQIPLFKNYQKYKNKFELDILGLNPMNDENVFALFINSQICKRINFYYKNNTDVENLEIVLKKIQNFWLDVVKSATKSKIVFTNSSFEKRFDFISEIGEKYLITFYKQKNIEKKQETQNYLEVDGFLEIFLISSDFFWEETKKNSIRILSSAEETFNSF